jgi:hypothetical protein
MSCKEKGQLKGLLSGPVFITGRQCFKNKNSWDGGTHTYNPAAQEAEAGGS